MGDLITKEGSISFLKLKMPPTVNKAYVNVNKRRFLSQSGKLFKQDVKAKVAELSLDCTETFWLDCEPLKLTCEFYFPALENKGWSTGKAKTRYKRIDVSNRVKLLEDAVSEGLDIDDLYFFQLNLIKREDKEADEPYVNVTIERSDVGCKD